jgi:hypothetical protein
VTVALQAPFSTSDAVDLSGGGRIFRKQILKKGTLDYDGRTLDFNDAYCTNLAEAFRAGEFDQVPFLLATADNAHNMLPERFRGELKGMIATDDGLDGVFELSEDGAQLIRDNPRLGVSCQIVPKTGRFKQAIRHVLGTLDPRLQKMRPWEAVELSTPGDTVLDLTQFPYNEREANVPEFTEDEMARLRALLVQPAPPAPTGGAPAPVVDDGDKLTPEEEAAIAALLAEPDKETAPVGAALSAEAQKAVDLANATADQAKQMATRMRRELWDGKLAAERATLGAKGYSPAVLDLVAPLLYGDGAVIDDPTVIELSHTEGGAALNVADRIRQILAAFGPQIDLTAEHPFAVRAPEGDKTKALLDQWEAETPMLSKGA